MVLEVESAVRRQRIVFACSLDRFFGGVKMKKYGVPTLAAAILAAAIFVYLLVPGSTAYAVIGLPPDVICVKALPLNPAVPHDTWSGRDITLKCTAHDADGDHSLWERGGNVV